MFENIQKIIEQVRGIAIFEDECNAAEKELQEAEEKLKPSEKSCDTCKHRGSVWGPCSFCCRKCYYMYEKAD